MGTSFCTVCAGTNFWREMLEFGLTQYARNLHYIKSSGLLFVFLSFMKEMEKKGMPIWAVTVEPLDFSIEARWRLIVG